MNNFLDCKAKEKLHKHIENLRYIMKEADILETAELNQKNNDVIIKYHQKDYVVECKSDAYNNGSIVIELIANCRKVLPKEFTAGFYNIGDDRREGLQELIVELYQKGENYRSTALYNFTNKPYILSYLSGYKVGQMSYYLIDLKGLSKWIKKHWTEKLLLINRDDSCSIMVKLFPEDFEQFLLYKKVETMHNSIINLN